MWWTRRNAKNVSDLLSNWLWNSRICSCFIFPFDFSLNIIFIKVLILCSLGYNNFIIVCDLIFITFCIYLFVCFTQQERHEEEENTEREVVNNDDTNIPPVPPPIYFHNVKPNKQPVPLIDLTTDIEIKQEEVIFEKEVINPNRIPWVIISLIIFLLFIDYYNLNNAICCHMCWGTQSSWSIHESSSRDSISSQCACTKSKR